MLSNVDMKNRPLPVIYGLAGAKLSKEEKAFIKEANPLGFILFGRNCETPEQIASLTRSLKKCVGREAPVLIDQEGGRVMRLKPPHWPDRRAAAKMGDDFKVNFSKGINAACDQSRAIAADLKQAGINVNCAPVLDVRFPETHEVIGNRAFSSDPDIVCVLGHHVCETYIENAIVPVIKHMPGHGRATQDSHKVLPQVDATIDEMRKSDFVPFIDIQNKAYADALWGMVAHVRYGKIDDALPASLSRRVIWDVIRGEIGFRGLLLSDDIDMGALETFGTVAERARAALRAGCDVVLQCNGNLADMKDVAEKMPPMTKEAAMRYNAALDCLRQNAARTGAQDVSQDDNGE